MTATNLEEVTMMIGCDKHRDELDSISVCFGSKSSPTFGIRWIRFVQPNKLMLKDLKQLKVGNVLVSVKDSNEGGWTIAYDQESAKYFLTHHLPKINTKVTMSSSTCLPTTEFEVVVETLITLLETFRAHSPGKRLDAIRLKAREIDEECAIDHQSTITLILT